MDGLDDISNDDGAAPTSDDDISSDDGDAPPMSDDDISDDGGAPPTSDDDISSDDDSAPPTSDDDISNDDGTPPMSDDDISDDDGAPPTSDEDEPPCPEPVLDQAAEPATTLSMYYMVQQLYRAMMAHLRARHSSAPSSMSTLLVAPRDAAVAVAAATGRYILIMRGISREGVLRWYGADGQPVEDDGGFGGVAAAEEATAALPETTAGDGEEGAECAVCLQDYEAGDKLRTMPCSHGFHERCLLPWLRVSRLCPLCRFALPAAVETECRPATWEDDGDDGHGQGEEESSTSMDQID